ncbi:hypothetical protein [Pseudomonas sp. GL-B-26]|uniref:hypothetical protein n=1 Tax=Pseudomonas sp. GL-B-26 TaxID=2832394 RepID=UPI001CBABD25|nr:hypothetical protein [Pseudomonas sp. GL-B-26]
MAKTEKPVSAELATPSAVSELLKFRDLVYTSRTLIIPKSTRTLPVAKGLVEVQSDDAEALAFLLDHEEFAPLKE